jgi:ParB family transcriptional regulator, chromosome partitioning protein
MEKNKRRMGLGKGLGALLSERPIETPQEERIVEEETSEISLDLIDINPFQPRTNFDSTALNELKESIQTQGIIQPVTVRKVGERAYQLISGERRLQASKLAGLSKIPAYIIEANDSQMLEMGLIENIQREDLNAIEIALAYDRLIKECNFKHEEISGRVGKDRSTVNNYLRLLNLPEIVQNGLREKKLSMGHARALLGVQDPMLLVKLFQEVVENDLTVRKVEEMVRNQSQPSEARKKTAKIPNPKMVLPQHQARLTKIFGKKVMVTADNETKGEITIPFISKEELDNILLKLKKKN